MAPRFGGALLLLLLLLLGHRAAGSWRAVDAAAGAFALACRAALPAPPLCALAPPAPPGFDFSAASATPLHASWAYAEALSLVKQHANASALRHAALLHANASAAPPPYVSRVAALTALAHDLRHARAYPEALAVLDEALGLAAGASAASPLLLAFQAEVQSCSGDARALNALRTLTRARKLDVAAAAAAAAAPDAPSDTAIDGALQELHLLRRALRLPGAQLPPQLRPALQAKHDALVARLLAAGPWRDALQLPRHFSPALRGAPWHDARGGAPPGAGAARWPAAAIAAATALLEAAAPAQRREYAALRDGGHLEPETECIAEPAWLLRGGDAGAWRVFTANGPWLRDVAESGGCSARAPAACAVMAQVAALGLGVQRVGYSALWPGARLHPHCGASNGVLKLHLGLHVPLRGSGRPCAALTVGNETRAWEAGKVLAFDDSFLHSVDFDGAGACERGGERVVLQVVIVHPDVTKP